MIGLAALAAAGATLTTAVVLRISQGRRPPGDGPSPRPDYREVLVSAEATAGLFVPGSMHLLNIGQKAVAEVVAGGVLHLPSGRLIAADPSWLPWERSRPAPFVAVVEPGDYPLSLALVTWSETRVAAARLTIRDEPVVTWEPALRPGQDPASLPVGHIYCVGVDVATIGLFDAIAMEAMAKRAEAEPDAFYRIGEPGRPAEVRDPASGANLIAFQTGLGDGCYPVWLGRTRSKDVACFMVDMLMLAKPG